MDKPLHFYYPLLITMDIAEYPTPGIILMDLRKRKWRYYRQINLLISHEKKILRNGTHENNNVV